MSELIADDVEEVDRPAVEGRPGGRGAVGGPFHFLQVLFIVSAEEQGIDQHPVGLPGGLRGLEGLFLEASVLR